MHLIGVGLQGINTFCDLDLSQGLATNVLGVQKSSEL